MPRLRRERGWPSLPPPAHRDVPPGASARWPPDTLFRPALWEAAHTFCPNGAGGYGVDADAAIGPLDRKVFGEPRRHELGRTIGALLLLTREPRDRGEANDRAAPKLQHRLYSILAAQEHTSTVHRHHILPVFGRSFDDVVERNNTGVGD